MDEIGKLVIQKFLPDVKDFHSKKENKETQEKMKKFLGQNIEKKVKEAHLQMYVGSMFQFLDPKKFKDKYNQAEREFGLKRDFLK